MISGTLRTLAPAGLAPARLAPTTLALAMGLLLAGPAIACADYDAAVAAVQADQAAEAARLYDVILTDAACDDAIREWVGDYLARDSFLYAMQDGTSDSDRRQALERALGYEKHWRSYAELGRIDWARQDYAGAAASFQQAINELVEGDPGHAAETSEIAEVYELATAAMALADRPVTPPRTRAGTAGGVFQTKIRGFSVEEVQLPITFAYNDTAFDAAGETYAKALAEYLGSIGSTSLRLVGHTDPRGDEAYNLALSTARATALADFLRGQGFAGQIEVSGVGEAEPPVVPEGIAADSEEFFRLARRVAFSVE